MNENDFNVEKYLRDLARMHEVDPENFEKLRAELIDSTINSFPDRFRKRARGIQFFIDHELDKHKDPVSRMNRMVELFWDKFHEFSHAMNDPVGFTVAREQNKKDGKVIPFN